MQTVQTVLSHYALGGGGVHGVTVEPVTGGWSGGQIWRVTDGVGGSFCLRQWPVEHPTVERLRLIHAVLLHVAKALPIVASPLRTTTGGTFVEHAGHLWELTTWRPGAADFHIRPSTARLRAAMCALATFHNLAATFERRAGFAPAVRERVDRLVALERGGFTAIERSVAKLLGNELDNRAWRMVELLKLKLQQPSLAAPLAGIGELPLQPAIRDIHHEHVLFTGDEVTGLIDFGALRIDTPLTDVARLMGSLVGEDRELQAAALNAYGELRPLSADDCRIVQLLDEAGVVLAAVNWLNWLYVERRDMGAEGPIARRLDEIIQRLQSKEFCSTIVTG